MSIFGSKESQRLETIDFLSVAGTMFSVMGVILAVFGSTCRVKPRNRLNLGILKDISCLPRFGIYVNVNLGGSILCSSKGLLERSTSIHGRFALRNLELKSRVSWSRWPDICQLYTNREVNYGLPG